MLSGTPRQTNQEQPRTPVDPDKITGRVMKNSHLNQLLFNSSIQKIVAF